MNHTKFRNKFIRNRAREQKLAFKKETNFVLSLVRKAKRHYYNSFHQKEVADNELFWHTIEPFFFSDKGIRSQNINMKI